MDEPPAPTTATAWQDAGIAAAYAAAPHTLERTVGYPAVFASLLVDRPGPATLLDYGCGPGEAARAAAHVFKTRVCAVDTSPAMLELARARPDPRIDYLQSHDGSLPFLPDASMDAAMCCFVFICVPSRDELDFICAEIHRVLRPGGRFAVLGSDPASIGQAGYDGWHTEPGPYLDGAPVHSRLRGPDGAWQDITDTFWSTATHRDVLADAGFRRVRTRILTSHGPHPATGGLLLVTGDKRSSPHRPLPMDLGGAVSDSESRRSWDGMRRA